MSGTINKVKRIAVAAGARQRRVNRKQVCGVFVSSPCNGERATYRFLPVKGCKNVCDDVAFRTQVHDYGVHAHVLEPRPRPLANTHAVNEDVGARQQKPRSTARDKRVRDGVQVWCVERRKGKKGEREEEEHVEQDSGKLGSKKW